MKRLLAVLAVAATPMLAAPAQACDWDHCPGTSIICAMDIVDCGTGARQTVCNEVDLPDPVC